MTAIRASASHHQLSGLKLIVGFVAGFIAVLLFHQPVLALLTHLGVAKAATYSLAATGPFGVPQVFSLSFWGGVWGVVFATIEHRIPQGKRYWVYAFLFGAIFPTLVAWFVVAPIKGLPMAGGWQTSRMLTGFIINGAWGVGNALLLTLGLRRSP
jgi:hypothetical protein